MLLVRNIISYSLREKLLGLENGFYEFNSVTEQLEELLRSDLEECTANVLERQLSVTARLISLHGCNFEGYK